MKKQDAVNAFAALAQETRLEVFRLLVRAGHEGLPAGGIAEELGVPAPTLSFHLAQLTASGLLERRREGRSIVYRVHLEGMRDLLTYLTEDCCQGRAELCGDLTKVAACGPRPCP